TDRLLDFRKRFRLRGSVFSDAYHDNLVVAQLDGITVESILQHRVAEQRCAHFGVARDTGSRIAGHISNFLNLETKLLGSRRKTAVVTERGVSELTNRFLETVLRALGTEIRGKLVANILESGKLGCLDVVKPDDVIAEVRFHRSTNLAFLHPEQGVLERAFQLAALDHAQAAAFFGGHGIIGNFGGNG